MKIEFSSQRREMIFVLDHQHGHCDITCKPATSACNKVLTKCGIIKMHKNCHFVSCSVELPNNNHSKGLSKKNSHAWNQNFDLQLGLSMF